ncbi:phage antirepressor KilAC domain-containing protein [Pseudomonas putida]
MDYETYSNPHSDEYGLTPLQHPNYEELLSFTETRSEIDHLYNDNMTIVGSRIIATITGKNHSHVIRDIRSLLDETKDDPDLDHVKFIKDSRGYTTEIKLTADLALALVSGYSGQMRLAMIRAIRQLESKALPSAAISSNKFLALAKLTNELVDTREQLTDQITTLKYQSYLDEHKVTFHDNMVNATNLFSIGEVSKLLGIGKNRLLKLMRKHKILMSGTKNHNQPYQKYINAGWLTSKLALTKIKAEDVQAKPETMITGKGVTCIAYLLEK